MNALLIVGAFVAISLHTEARAADEPATQPEERAGMLPIPVYSGDIWHRHFLLGELGGTRADLADFGIQLDVNFTQVVQSVVDGGVDTGARLGLRF